MRVNIRQLDSQVVGMCPQLYIWPFCDLMDTSDSFARTASASSRGCPRVTGEPCQENYDLSMALRGSMSHAQRDPVMAGAYFCLCLSCAEVIRSLFGDLLGAHSMEFSVPMPCCWIFHCVCGGKSSPLVICLSELAFPMPSNHVSA